MPDPFITNIFYVNFSIILAWVWKSIWMKEWCHPEWCGEQKLKVWERGATQARGFCKENDWWLNRERNKKTRRRFIVRRRVGYRVDQAVVKWLGYDEERLSEGGDCSNDEGFRNRRQPCMKHLVWVKNIGNANLLKHKWSARKWSSRLLCDLSNWWFKYVKFCETNFLHGNMEGSNLPLKQAATFRNLDITKHMSLECPIDWKKTCF